MNSVFKANSLCFASYSTMIGTNNKLNMNTLNHCTHEIGKNGSYALK